MHHNHRHCVVVLMLKRICKLKSEWVRRKMPYNGPASDTRYLDARGQLV